MRPADLGSNLSSESIQNKSCDFSVCPIQINDDAVNTNSTFESFREKGCLQKNNNINSSHNEEDMDRHYQETIIKKNIKVKIGKGSQKCEICFKQFTHAIYLKRHLRTHTGEKPYKCDVCFKKFSLAGNLKSHLMTNTGEKPHKCEICFKQFLTAGCLQKINIHSSHSEEDMGRHDQETIIKKNIKAKIGKGYHKCQICFKQFTNVIHLKLHLRTHTEKKPYNCDICFKKFTLAANLKLHLMAHTGEKPHNEEDMGRHDQETIIKKYIKVKIGKGSHKCEICFKQFAHSIQLKHHLRTHTGEKPYKCDVCFKKFTQAVAFVCNIVLYKPNKHIIAGQAKY
ncbi:zinc finger protein 431-like [Diabrotica virgifera virgifera]|uniref:C2H2-type domain-containing protein n=1 Tax=Diabrotica virgifera virgifera TaxID=50390 RepID=A0ABM5KEM8_DIAVI|nr:zinc finger protein 431-like [Diabrotica virgifera virgifera]